MNITRVTANGYTTRVEKVAKALREEDEQRWDLTPQWQRNLYRIQARAAMRALGYRCRTKKGGAL